MDGDPAVETPLDSFSLAFPLPYRVAFIIVLGAWCSFFLVYLPAYTNVRDNAAVWGWGINLHYLYLLKIDVPSLIRYPQRTSSTQPAHHLSTYRLATVLSFTFAFSICAFWVFSRGSPERVVAYDWMPMTCLLVVALLFVVPLRSFALSHGGRARLLGTLRRVSIGGLAEADNGKFGDILLADVLTSYSKVLGDLFVCICMFLTRGGSATDQPDRSCGGAVIVPLIMAVPSLIRFRQCLIEYGRARRGSGRDSGRQHLANAAKYASAFPVIVLSALQRNLPDQDTHTAGVGLYRAWLAAVLVNSLYSFYWDVARDWDLTLFSARERNSPDHAFGLRRRLYLQPAPGIYYAVILLDLLLRCMWSLKLSRHLDHLADFESSIFIAEFLEVFRRWVWIFFRVETEWIRASSVGLAEDDILLGDYTGKYEDEEE